MVLVWVHLGERIPNHLLRNIGLHAEMYPGLKQYLLVDFPHLRAFREDLTVINVGKFEDYYSDSRFIEGASNRTTSQKPFWNRTTLRFFALHTFMMRYEVERAIHLESDCILLDLHAIELAFHFKGWKVSYPLQANEVGCASLLLLNGSDALNNLLGLVKKRWTESNQDDMKLLGLHSTSNEVLVLPWVPEGAFTYDPQIYGRFLFGTDARNIRFPFSQRGLYDLREGSVNPGKFSFELEVNQGNPSLVIFNGSISSKLANLHLHSKYIPKSRKSLIRYTRRGISKMHGRLWHVGKLDGLVFLERLMSRVTSLLRGSKQEIRLR
jgi:hypothetical protein